MTIYKAVTEICPSAARTMRRTLFLERSQPPPPPLSLTDSELATVLAAAQLLDPDKRNALLERVLRHCAGATTAATSTAFAKRPCAGCCIRDAGNLIF